jgi:beta-glucosidase
MRRLALFLPLAVVCASALAFGQAADTPVYRDPSKPIEARIRDLVGRLTIEEKAQQLNHLNKGLPRLGIKQWGGWNQTLHGVWSAEPTTLFPIPTAMGATWDPDLVHRVADAMSDEARALYNAGKNGPRSPHGLVYRSPVINISRDPRWGRIQEVFSEDPYLTGRMAVAYVRGLQGQDVSRLKVAATVKHFAVNNVEAGRQHLSVVVDDRNLYDFWFPHWKAAFQEGKAQSVMSSYNAINGVPAAVNRWLLTDVLRKQWGFDGFVTDDLGAVQLLSAERNNDPGHRFSPDPVVSTAAAIKAGNDSDDQEFEDNIPKAVQRGLLTMADVDAALSNVLRVGFRLGAFDPSTPYDAIPMSVVRRPEHLALSLQVAQRSLTLLSNRNVAPPPAPGAAAPPPVFFLPRKRDETRSIAVIGSAGDQDYPTGNYYGTPARKVGVVQGLREVLGSGVRVDYERGADVVGPADADAVARAVALAKKSDVVILCLGTDLRVEAESRDRRDLDLPGAQQPLLEAVFAANPRVALVLFNAGPLGVGWAHDRLPAILAAWFPGEAGGIAIARALFGIDNPGGKLPYTVYANLDGVPPQHEYDVSKGYTYQYFKGVPLYPFGHGLSYTRFRFSNMTLSASTIGVKGSVEIAFDVTNVGDRPGDEVAQLYTHQMRSRSYQPIRTLRAFKRVTLQPQETARVTFTLPASQLAWYQGGTIGSAVEPGAFDLGVGASSDNIRLRATLTVAAGGAARPAAPKPARPKPAAAPTAGQ